MWGLKMDTYEFCVLTSSDGNIGRIDENKLSKSFKFIPRAGDIIDFDTNMLYKIDLVVFLIDDSDIMGDIYVTPIKDSDEIMLKTNPHLYRSLK
jgi:hypothetical protein